MVMRRQETEGLYKERNLNHLNGLTLSLLYTFSSGCSLVTFRRWTKSYCLCTRAYGNLKRGRTRAISTNINIYKIPLFIKQIKLGL